MLSHVYEVDHKTPLCMGGDNSESNLQALCRECHGRKTFDDKEKVRANQSLAGATRLSNEDDDLLKKIYTLFERRSDAKVSLKKIWEALKADQTLFEELGMKMSRELSQKLKTNGFDIYYPHGLAYVRGLRSKPMVP